MPSATAVVSWKEVHEGREKEKEKGPISRVSAGWRCWCCCRRRGDEGGAGVGVVSWLLGLHRESVRCLMQ
jgi:hypothetical protein